MSYNRLLGGVAGAALAIVCVAEAQAQTTSGAMRGRVLDTDGAPVTGAAVIVQDVRTNTLQQISTDSTGAFSARGLRVGGPYTVTASAAGFGTKQIDDLFVNLGDTLAVTVELGEPSVDTIVVSASAISAIDVAVGPAATFDLDVLKNAPAINRNITDVIRQDARVYVDESRGGINAVQCGGKNSRFNSLTVDGIRQNDNFGLNANGYPTERIPFSYDAIQEVAVELAPFDVQYGGFSACNINAVTKSGENEFHGGAFVDYTSNDLRGGSLEGEEITTGDYNEYRYGVHVGGPIVEDKLFFFAAYERLEGANLFDRGPLGSGAVDEVNITQAEVDEILAIARDVYQYDPGTIPLAADNEDDKLLVKLDWNINQNHRAAFTYTYNDGYNIVQSDGDNSELEFSNHLYERGAELNSYVGSVYSDWTDRFSTEVRLGYSELDNRQISLGGGDFGEIRVETDDVDVYLGGDDSRQSNKLAYETFNVALKGFYNVGAHELSFGYEQEKVDVFNLFIQHTETEIRFDGIENFRGGFADAIYFNNAPSLNPNDAAAEWGYAVHTLYAQDNYDFGNGLSVTAGLRYDFYSSDDNPPLNEDFLADYGFGNNENLDGVDLIQPRIAFTWDVTDALDLRGGVGIYSGGNPNVWYSNNYSNNNVVQFGQRGRSFNYTDGTRSLFDTDVEYVLCEDGVPEGPGYCVPSELADAVAAGDGDNFEINYLDPDFKLPNEIKFSFGGTTLVDLPSLGGEYVVTADALYTITRDSAIWIRGDLEQVGTVTGPNGGVYPDYDSVREPAFQLTNADEDAKSLLLSASVAKDYENGFDWALGYAYSDAEDVHPMTSSVAFSNYVNRVFLDPQAAVAATSDYNTRHRFTAIANWERAFFGDNLTKVSAFGSLNSGRPYSLVWDGFTGTSTIYGFTPYLDFIDNVLYFDGQSFSERNGEEGSWWGKVDLKFEQEIPGIGDDKAAAYIIIDNFTNLIDDEWGILREPGFPTSATFDDEAPESRVGDASRYEIRFGLRYEF